MIRFASPKLSKNSIDAVVKVLNSGNLVQGPVVLQLEQIFKKTCKTKYAVALNNGTAALHTALYAAGIQKDDEVITTPFTFVSTANAIRMVGAKPVFVDIDKQSYNLDPKKIEKAITPKTKALLPVNLYGLPADYDEINEIASKYKLVVIEDAAQSINANYHSKKSGNLADISCFSLYATKNVIAGEGGMITTNNEAFYKKSKLFRHHGQEEGKRYEYVEFGYNYRLTDIHAAVALKQMKKVDEITKNRQNIAKLYTKYLQNISGIITPFIAKDRTSVFHQYTIRITSSSKVSRDKLKELLYKEGVETNIYYPKPLHLQQTFKHLGYKKGNLPIAEEASNQVLSLPIYPQLSNRDVKYICDIINEYEN